MLCQNPTLFELGRPSWLPFSFSSRGVKLKFLVVCICITKSVSGCLTQCLSSKASVMVLWEPSSKSSSTIAPRTRSTLANNTSTARCRLDTITKRDAVSPSNTTMTLRSSTGPWHSVYHKQQWELHNNNENYTIVRKYKVTFIYSVPVIVTWNWMMSLVTVLTNDIKSTYMARVRMKTQPSGVIVVLGFNGSKGEKRESLV